MRYRSYPRPCLTTASNSMAICSISQATAMISAHTGSSLLLLDRPRNVTECRRRSACRPCSPRRPSTPNAVASSASSGPSLTINRTVSSIMPKVLILGGRSPVALDHARRFAAQGWRVTVADSASCRLTGWSRAVTSTVRLASPRQASKQFIADLCSVIVQHDIDLVVPTCEEVFFLSRYRSALPNSCRVVVDDFETLRGLHSKWDFLPIAARAGGNPPDSTLVDTIEQAREWASDKAIVLKPEFSRFGVHVRMYPEGIPRNASALPELGRWVAQEYCVGTELCSYSIAEQGHLTAHALYRPVHRLHRSASYYFEPHASEPIRDFVAKLVNALQF